MIRASARSAGRAADWRTSALGIYETHVLYVVQCPLIRVLSGERGVGWDWVTEVREVGAPVRKAVACSGAPAGRAGWVWRRSLAWQLRAADRRPRHRRQVVRARFQR